MVEFFGEKFCSVYVVNVFEACSQFCSSTGTIVLGNSRLDTYIVSLQFTDGFGYITYAYCGKSIKTGKPLCCEKK